MSRIKWWLYRWLVGDVCPLKFLWREIIRKQGIEVGRIYQGNEYFLVCQLNGNCYCYCCLADLAGSELRQGKEIVDLVRDGEQLWVFAGNMHYYKREGCIFDANQ